MDIFGPLAPRRFIPQGAAKTASYSMASWHVAHYNTTSGAIVQPLPASPTTGDRVRVVLDAGTNAVSFTFGGVTVTSISTATHTAELEYNGTTWEHASGWKSQSSQDARYVRRDPRVFDIKADGGALGDRTTDDSAAFVAAYTAALNGMLVDPSGSNRAGSVKIKLPPGRYLVTQPNALMGTTSGSRAVGLIFEGSGEGLTEIVFQPSTGAGNYLATNPDRWLSITFSGLTFTCATASASFMLSQSNGGAQDYRFERCAWRGSWTNGVALDGISGSANTNSEIVWDQCTVNGSYTGAFLNIGLGTGGSGQDQFVDYAFNDCKVEYSYGTFVNAPYGGNINCRGGSYILTGTDASHSGLFFSMPAGVTHSYGVQRLSIDGTRFETRNDYAKLIDCAWKGGVVQFTNVDHSVETSSGSFTATTILADFHFGNDSGPVVLFESCALEGRHRYNYTVSGWQAAPRVTYDSCWISQYSSAHDFIVTRAEDSNSNAGGTSPIDFIHCRGNASSSVAYEYPFDCTVNWEKSTGANPKQRSVSFRTPAGQVPGTLAGNVDVWLPLNSVVTSIRFHKPSGEGSSTATTWSYTVQTNEGTPTALAVLDGGGIYRWADGFDCDYEVQNFTCSTDAQRHLTLVPLVIDQASTLGFVTVEYMA